MELIILKTRKEGVVFFFFLDKRIAGFQSFPHMHTCEHQERQSVNSTKNNSCFIPSSAPGRHWTGPLRLSELQLSNYIEVMEGSSEIRDEKVVCKTINGPFICRDSRSPSQLARSEHSPGRASTAHCKPRALKPHLARSLTCICKALLGNLRLHL